VALVGFQGRGVVEAIRPDFSCSVLLETLIFQRPEKYATLLGHGWDIRPWNPIRATRDRERSARLMAVVDYLNVQMGSGTMQYATAGLKPRWIMRSTRRSPRYTMKWEELVVVRAV
jgi:hypothetical protein